MTTTLEQLLRDYFRKQGGSIITKEHIRIGLGEGDVLCLLYILEEDKRKDVQYELYDEVRGLQQLIESFSLQSVDDLQNIQRSNLWLRFLAERAEVIFTNEDGNSIHFRLFRGKTMVYSIDFHYYDEVMKLLNMTSHFKKYIRENWEELEGLDKRG